MAGGRYQAKRELSLTDFRRGWPGPLRLWGAAN
jgi:hypothetical protein